MRSGKFIDGCLQRHKRVLSAAWYTLLHEKRGRLHFSLPQAIAISSLISEDQPGIGKGWHQFISLTPTETANPVSDMKAEALNSSSGR